MTSCLSNGSESLQLYYLLVQLKFYSATRRGWGADSHRPICLNPRPFISFPLSLFPIKSLEQANYSSKKTLLCNPCLLLKGAMSRWYCFFRSILFWSHYLVPWPTHMQRYEEDIKQISSGNTKQWVFWWFFAGIACWPALTFQNSTHVHPSHTLQQTTENSFNA